MPAASVPASSASTFSLNMLRLYRQGTEQSCAPRAEERCCCTIEDLVRDNGKESTDDSSPELAFTELGEHCSGHSHEHFCHLHSAQAADGFVQTERRLTRNLLLLSFTSSIALGVVYTLISLDRYFFGPWTFLGLSAAFLIGALSVYYAQACVTRLGPNLVLALATCSIILFVLVHFSSSFMLFQLGAIGLALCLGPFYAAQLEFVSHFTSRLVHLTVSIKRHHEERSHRLLHLLLFCPSHIVGHLVFVLLGTSLSRISTDKGATERNAYLTVGKFTLLFSQARQCYLAISASALESVGFVLFGQ